MLFCAVPLHLVGCPYSNPQLVDVLPLNYPHSSFIPGMGCILYLVPPPGVDVLYVPVPGVKYCTQCTVRFGSWHMLYCKIWFLAYTVYCTLRSNPLRIQYMYCTVRSSPWRILHCMFQSSAYTLLAVPAHGDTNTSDSHRKTQTNRTPTRTSHSEKFCSIKM